jgi:hypothetical protein
MNLLIIHPGHTLPRHSKVLKVISLLIKKIIRPKIYLTDFKSIHFANDIRSGLGSMPETKTPFSWNFKRDIFDIKFNKEFKFCDAKVKLNKYITKKEKKEIICFLNSLPKSLSVNDLMKMNWRGVNIGTSIWSSIQRYCFIGKPNELKLIPNTILYEYVKSGLYIATSFDNLFKTKLFDLVLLNEVSYINWGLPMKFALKYSIKVITLSHGYLGNKYIGINTYNNLNDIIIPCGVPNDIELDQIYSDSNLKNKYISIYNEFFGEFENKYKSLMNKLDLTSNSHNNKIQVVVFTHLCWDATLAYADKLFETFEDWLVETFNIARNNPNVNWVFKVHPHEADLSMSPRSESTSPIVNTYTFLKDLLNNYPSKNITIFTKSDNMLILPYTNYCVSVLGTCRYELTSLGIPVILAEKSMNKNNGFSICASSIKAYNRILNNISSYSINEEQIELAKIYAGAYYDKERYFDLTDLFLDNNFNKEISENKIDIFLTNEFNNKLIKKILDV